MTPAERENPKIINGSRRLRIANGSGVKVNDVNQLVDRFFEARKMMSQMGGMGMPGMRRRADQVGEGQEGQEGQGSGGRGPTQPRMPAGFPGGLPGVGPGGFGGGAGLPQLPPGHGACRPHQAQPAEAVSRRVPAVAATSRSPELNGQRSPC